MSRGRLASLALVGAQFALLAALAYPPAAFVPHSAHAALGLALALGAVALALLAARAMRATRFSVLPEPRAGGAFVERGPYRRVRHPMYAAALLGGLGAAVAHADAAHAAWLAALGVVLGLKIRREERLLLAAYPGYADYRRRVGALLPRRAGERRRERHGER